MRIEQGAVGGLVVYGTLEEWQRFAAGLEELYSELTHEVLPGAHSPTAGGVIVTLNEALAIMAVMVDEELTRSLMTIVVAGRSPKRHDGDR
jgi:hypothetical protein